jgi:hypothetical protein
MMEEQSPRSGANPASHAPATDPANDHHVQDQSATAGSASNAAREMEESATLQADTKRLLTALEDIVALAHSSGDHRARVILMQRRAMAALAGTDRPLPSAIKGTFAANGTGS